MNFWTGLQTYRRGSRGSKLTRYTGKAIDQIFQIILLLNSPLVPAASLAAVFPLVTTDLHAQYRALTLHHLQLALLEPYTNTCKKATALSDQTPLLLTKYEQVNIQHGGYRQLFTHVHVPMTFRSTDNLFHSTLLPLLVVLQPLQRTTYQTHRLALRNRFHKRVGILHQLTCANTDVALETT